LKGGSRNSSRRTSIRKNESCRLAGNEIGFIQQEILDLENSWRGRDSDGKPVEMGEAENPMSSGSEAFLPSRGIPHGK
jgi:hypothetical protein